MKGCTPVVSMATAGDLRSSLCLKGCDTHHSISQHQAHAGGLLLSYIWLTPSSIRIGNSTTVKDIPSWSEGLKIRHFLSLPQVSL